MHLHSRLLHELAGGQGHGPQHVLSAALEHLLQDLAGHKAGNIMASSGRATSCPVRKGESTSTPRGWHHPGPCPRPPITPPVSCCWKSGCRSPFRAILLQGGLREPTPPIREGLCPEEPRASQEGGHTDKPLLHNGINAQGEVQNEQRHGARLREGHVQERD